jgi:hypothetical protein
MLVYISGGRVTDNTNYFSDFYMGEIQAIQLGYKTVNPTLLATMFPNLTNEQYLALDYKLIDMADGIFMLHEWQKSKGACAELSYAKSLGKKVIYQDYFGRGKK